jgi:hypothetical protein
MNDIKVVNAIIKYARIDDGDRGLVTSYIGLDYGDSGHQGFGGYALYLPDSFAHGGITKPNYAGHWIYKVIQVAGVSDWSKVVGKSIRVKRESGLNGKVIGIGHITKDIWFIPSEDFKKDES